MESVVNSDDSIYIDNGFAVHFIIFDGNKKSLPGGKFTKIIFKRPLSQHCAEIVKHFRTENCRNFENLLKGGIVDLTMLANGNCLIFTLSFGAFFLRNENNIKVCLKKVFKDYFCNLNQFCENSLGKDLISKIESCQSLSEAIDVFCKHTDMGIIIYNLEEKKAKPLARRNVKPKEQAIYVLYEEEKNHVGFLYDLAIRYAIYYFTSE